MTNDGAWIWLEVGVRDLLRSGESADSIRKTVEEFISTYDDEPDE